MNELITRCLQEKNIKPLSEFPPELLTETEMEMINSIIAYERKHKKPPTVKRFMEKFEFFIPFVFSKSKFASEPDPLTDVLEQTINRKMVEITNRKLKEAQAELNDSGKIPIDTLRDIERTYTMSMGVERFSMFDRELYFTRDAIDIPFKLINKKMHGLGKGDFLLIIGRLGTGKSTVAQWLSKHAWMNEMKVLMVSAEMLYTDVFARLDAMVGKFNPLILRDEKTSGIDETLSKIKDKAGKSEGEIIIPRSRLVSPSQISAFAMNLDIDLVVVDGCYLLNPSDGYFKSNWEKVKTVSNELKQVALDLKVPMIGTAQIKRGADGDDGYKPEDIAYADALGQDADYVIAINPNKVIKGRAELQLIKNRFGDLISTQIYTDFDNMTIIDETLSGAVEVEEKKETKTMTAKEWLEI